MGNIAGWIEMWKIHLPNESEETASTSVQRKLYYISGKHCLVHQEGLYFREGLLQLAIGAELGDLDCAILLCRVETRNPLEEAPSTAFNMIKDLAYAGTNWEVIVLYVEILRQRKTATVQRAELFALAARAFEITEPDDRDLAGIPGMYVTTPPWKLLNQIADEILDDPSVPKNSEDYQLAVETWDKTIKAGALQYRDPEACEICANQLAFVTPHSDVWLNLMTKAAMNGRDDAAFWVGKYWLEKYNWYPCRGEPDTTAQGSIGIDWIEVSAVLNGEAQTMAERFLTLAFVHRENGLRQRGKDWLEVGQLHIQSSTSNEQEIQRHTKYLESFVRNWDRELKGVGNSAAELLGAPVKTS